MKLPKDLLGALKILDEEGLGDWIYDIRERELRGWDGPRVKAFGKACGTIKKYLRETNNR